MQEINEARNGRKMSCVKRTEEFKPMLKGLESVKDAVALPKKKRKTTMIKVES